MGAPGIALASVQGAASWLARLCITLRQGSACYRHHYCASASCNCWSPCSIGRCSHHAHRQRQQIPWRKHTRTSRQQQQQLLTCACMPGLCRHTKGCRSRHRGGNCRLSLPSRWRNTSGNHRSLYRVRWMFCTLIEGRPHALYICSAALTLTGPTRRKESTWSLWAAHRQAGSHLLPCYCVNLLLLSKKHALSQPQ